MAKRRPRIESLEERLCMAAGPTLQTSISLPTSGSWTPTVYRASPIFADLFNTGKDNLIAVAAGAQLIAYTENANGTASVAVTYQVPNGVADIKSTPIVVTDPRTGQKDLFAAMGRDETNPGSLEDGRVFGWNAQTGQLLPAWASGLSSGVNVDGQSGVYGALTSGNLTGNGIPDIVVTSFSHDVTAFSIDGTQLWQWTNDDTILSGAVIGDIYRDGHQEVVVGGDSSNSAFYQAGGWVNILSSTGTLERRIFIPGEVTWSSPVLADLQGNGLLDIVIGTGLNYQAQNVPGAQAAGDKIFAFDPFGNLLPGWPYATTTPTDPVPHEVLAAPAVADLLGNGQLEVIAIDRAGYLHVVQANGQDLPGFVGGKAIAPNLPQNLIPDDYASPIVADINGDGKPEIIAAAGPYLQAFDTSGNLIPIATTITPPGGSPEGIDTAAAVGNFDGTAGLTLAFVSYNAQLQNRPDQVMVYSLPASTLAPPWAMLRRTASGDAVARSPIFDQEYVAEVYNTVLGSIPAQSVLQPSVDALNAGAPGLFDTTLAITSSPLARQAEITRLYQAFLLRPPTTAELTAGTTFLATGSYAQEAINLASSAEFASRAGNNIANEVSQLYQAILNRTPSQAEINVWVQSGLSVGTIAGLFIGSPEGTQDQFNNDYSLAFGSASLGSVPADALPTFSLDFHGGVREEVSIANLLTSGGNYAATNVIAGYVRDLYRDILKRDATPAEVGGWVTGVSNGTVSLLNLPAVFLNSIEAKVNYVEAEFQALLGRTTDLASALALANYTNREAIVILIVGSPEYFSKNGGTNSTFVQAAFRDLAGIGIDATNLNAFVTKMNAGLTTTQVAQQIIYGGSLYFTNTAVQEITQYLPNEQLGVLRSGNLPPGAAGQPINPNPILIDYLLNFYGAGFTDEDVIGILLTSPDYFSRISYYKGILRSPGIRN